MIKIEIGDVIETYARGFNKVIDLTLKGLPIISVGEHEITVEFKHINSVQRNGEIVWYNKISEAIKIIESKTNKKVFLKEVDSREKDLVVKNASTVSDSYEIFRTDLQSLADSLNEISEYNNERVQINALILKLQRLEETLNKLIQ